MSEHPIQGLMSTTMQNIKEMVDVNTIVGDPVESPDGSVIIPISKVSFGFAAGGSEFQGGMKENRSEDDDDESSQSYSSNSQGYPFGGGSGAGVGIMPIGFLVVNKENIKFMPTNTNSSLDKVLEFVPEIVEKLDESVRKMMSSRKDHRPYEESKKTTIAEE